jgi:hypothetical protein
MGVSREINQRNPRYEIRIREAKWESHSWGWKHLSAGISDIDRLAMGGGFS